MGVIAFRADASLQIGTGHVMRCLTLADVLAANGAQCEFICREHPGHLIEYIRSKGYAVHSLPMRSEADTDLAHSQWLGATQAQDAQACAPLLAQLQPDWLVVDHYALDARWESTHSAHSSKVMAIDDLADRAHVCQILLDQTFRRAADDYRHRVPAECILLCGSNYALLRPEFAALRPYSLRRRAQPRLKKLLVTLGGVDKDNITTQVLNALRSCSLPADCEVTVVMGAMTPWLADVQAEAKTMPWPTNVHVGVNDMAQLMADSDLAIGAAGSTALERCCLGLGTLLLVLAANQTTGAYALQKCGAAQVLLSPLDIPHVLHNFVHEGLALKLEQMGKDAAAVTDGNGAQSVAVKLISESPLV